MKASLQLTTEMIDRILDAFQAEHGYVVLDELPGWLLQAHGHPVRMTVHNAVDWKFEFPTEQDKIVFLLKWQ